MAYFSRVTTCSWTGRPGRAGCLAIVVCAAAIGCRGAETDRTNDPWETARRKGIDFRAVGQEPGWFLEIDDETTMRLVYDYMEREATVPAPRPTVAPGRTTYASVEGRETITVTIEARACHDVMSGDAHPATVTVTIDGRELRGCGRPLR